MSFHLAIETSNVPTSVALLKGEEVLGERLIEVQNQTSALLASYIPQLLEKAGITEKDLDFISIGEGPGSYTGLRVGMSLAKGLSYSLKIPLIPIGSLEALAYGFAQAHDLPEETLLIPLYDARRGKVYAAGYTLNMDCIYNPRIVQLNELIDELANEKKTMFFSPNSEKLLNFIKEKPIIRNFEIKAHFVGLKALKKENKNKYLNGAYLKPSYINNNYL